MKTILIALVATVAVPTAALAIQPAPVAQPVRAPQAQTRAVAAQHVQALFARLDTNRDGALTRQEAQAGRQAMRGKRDGRRFGQAGQMRQRDPNAAFARFDLNRDGVINRQEFAQVHAQRQQRRAAGLNRGQRGMGFGLGGRMFEMADANRDGRVTIQEATAAAYRRFDQTDLNRDGVVTREERQQSRTRMRGQRG